MKNNKPDINDIVLDEDEYFETITVGELQVGDVLIGSKGRVNVTEEYDVHVPDEFYEIETDSGDKLEMSGNHLLYIVTALDRDLHAHRLSRGKAFGKKLSSNAVDILVKFANSDVVGSGNETTVNNFIMTVFEDEALLDSEIHELINMVIRVSESIGVTAEQNAYFDDFSNGGLGYEGTVPLYDRRMLSKQLLSLFNIDKYRKTCPVIVGRVIQASGLERYCEMGEVFIPDPVNVQSKYMESLNE